MPLPRLGGIASGLGGLANVLGLGLEGYAKDQATRVERERNRIKDIQDAQMLGVQMDEHNANIESRKAATALAKNKGLAQQGAFNQLQQRYPTHPSVAAGYVEGGEYTDILDKAMAQESADKKADLENRSRFASLVANFPDDPVVQSFAKGGYTPEKAFALKDVWESADKRYGIEHAYHTPAAPKGMWAHDASTNSDVWVTPEQAASAPGRFTKPGAAGGGMSKLAAPVALRVGQFGEMLKKSKDLVDITEGLSVNAGESAAQDVAEHGFKIGGVSVPGSRGVGSWLANRSTPYATYQAVLTPFVTAAAHAIGGARVTQVQIDQIRNSIEIKPGDAPELKATKAKNMFDLINSTGGALPSEAIAVQESQMDPAALIVLRQHGYKGGGLGGSEPLTVDTTKPPPKVRAESTGTTKPAPARAAGAYSGMDDGAVWDQAVRENGIAAVLKEFGTRAQFIARGKR